MCDYAGFSPIVPIQPTLALAPWPPEFITQYLLFCHTHSDSIVPIVKANYWIHVARRRRSGQLGDTTMLTILIGIIALALLPIAFNVLLNLLDAVWAFVTKPAVLFLIVFLPAAFVVWAVAVYPGAAA